jgi:hypothetical protein
VVAVTPQVHLWNLAPDMIGTVHFGYQYDEAEMAADMASLLATGARPAFYQLVADRGVSALSKSGS